jgi:hypothetical protein
LATDRLDMPGSAQARMMFARKAKPCAVDRRLLQLNSVARSSPDTVMGMACGLAMAVSSFSVYLITMRLSRTSFKFPTRTTRSYDLSKASRLQIIS